MGADSYALFSEMVTDLTDEEIAWLSRILALSTEAAQAEFRDKEDYPRVDWALLSWPGFVYEIEAEWRSLWFYSDTYFDDNALVLIFQEFLRKFRPDKRISVEIAYTCSEPHVGEFGGSWLLIGAVETLSGSTRGAIEVILAQCAPRSWWSRIVKW